MRYTSLNAYVPTLYLLNFSCKMVQGFTFESALSGREPEEEKKI